MCGRIRRRQPRAASAGQRQSRSPAAVSDLTVKPPGLTVQSDEIDIVQRDTNISYRVDVPEWGRIAGSARRHVTIQVKYTNPGFVLHGTGPRKFPRTNQSGGRESMLLIYGALSAMRLGRRGSQKDRWPQEKPCFFWIKSSARRAFGGCLGRKRR